MTDTVLTKVTELAWSMLESYDIDPLPLFREANIDPSALDDMTSRLSRPTVHALWSSVADNVHDPCFGLRAANLWHPSYMHALGYAWLSSDTLRSALERLARYIKILNRELEICLLEEDAHLDISVLNKPDSLPRDEDWQADLDMSTLLAMCRADYGDHFTPAAVYFRHPEPKCAARFFELFRCSVHFGAERDHMLISDEVADRHLPGSNPMMLQIHDQEMIRYLAQLDKNDIVQRVKNTVLELLPDGGSSDTRVAAAMSMSDRSLQRRLQSEGTTFKSILTDVRREMALKYIQDKQLTLTEISFLLGFSEMSAFSRAFKKWTGVSPTEQRRTVLGS